MNQSSRWCVTAVVALTALGCSDPVPPPAQGSFIADVRSGVAGRQCPSGAAITYDVPSKHDTDPTHVLTGDSHPPSVIDGASGAVVSCSVKGSTSFTFEGSIKLGVQGFAISGGTINAADGKGTARVTLIKPDTPGFSNALSSAPAGCTVQAVTLENKLQLKPGSMWASYTCPSVLHEPGEGCTASGFFVLENCSQ